MERTAFCLLLHTLHMYWFSPSSFSSCTQRMHTAWFESNLAWTVMPSGLKILKQKWLLEFRLVSTYIHLAWTQIIRFEHIHCRNIHYLAQIHTLPKIHNLVWTYTLPVLCCVYEHTHCLSFAGFYLQEVMQRWHQSAVPTDADIQLIKCGFTTWFTATPLAPTK